MTSITGGTSSQQPAQLSHSPINEVLWALAPRVFDNNTPPAAAASFRASTAGQVGWVSCKGRLSLSLSSPVIPGNVLLPEHHHCVLHPQSRTPHITFPRFPIQALRVLSPVPLTSYTSHPHPHPLLTAHPNPLGWAQTPWAVQSCDGSALVLRHLNSSAIPGKPPSSP